jgi:hypothetical protein
MLESLQLWLESTAVHRFVLDNAWVWPGAESLHFIGLSILIGTVGLFDLRMLGMAKGISMSGLHRLIRWGICGFGINALTGFLFFAGTPDQYMYNPAFRLKMLFVSLAGVNILVFYTMLFRKIKTLDAGDDAPFAAKIIGAVSLLLWIGVMTCGRLLTFFRPPYHWQ